MELLGLKTESSQFRNYILDNFRYAYITLGQLLPPPSGEKPVLRHLVEYLPRGLQIFGPDQKWIVISWQGVVEVRDRYGKKFPLPRDPKDLKSILQVFRMLAFLPVVMNPETREQALKAYQQPNFQDSIKALSPIARAEVRVQDKERNITRIKELMAGLEAEDRSEIKRLVWALVRRKLGSDPDHELVEKFVRRALFAVSFPISSTGAFSEV